MLKYLNPQLGDSRTTSHRVLLVLIILIGFLLRWYSLFQGHAYTYFTIKDEISALRYAFAFMAGDPTAYYLGQPALNQGHIPGPLWAMFVAGIYKLGGSSVQGALFMMTLLNTLVIYLVYRLAGKMMSPAYALFSALFYALAPWAIYYAVGLYNPMVLALLGVLLYLALWNTLFTPSSRSVFWVVVICAAIPQFHMIGVFYYPVILLLLLFSPNRINLRWLSLGVVAGICLYIPYIAGEISHHWQNLHQVLHSKDKFSLGVLKVLSIPLAMLSNTPGQWPGYTTVELRSFADQWFGFFAILIAINLTSLALAVLFVSRMLRRFSSTLRKSRFNLKNALIREPAYTFIAILLTLPLLFYTLTGKDYATRYSIFIFPLLFLLPGLYLSGIKKQKYKTIVLYTFSFMFLSNIYLVLSFYTDQHNRLNHGSEFMPSFKKLAALEDALRKYAGPNKKIIVDDSRLINRNSKYWDITTQSVTNYITLMQNNILSGQNARQAMLFILVGDSSEIPPHAITVYHDNKLYAYVK